MEVKVDVHTVHPASIKDNQTAKSAISKGPYASWGTPDTSPVHSIIKKNKTTIEHELRDDTAENKRSMRKQRVQLFRSASSKQLKSITDYENELEYLDEFGISTRNKIKTRPQKPVKKVQLVERPQSPAPSWPRHEEKSKGFQLPAFCDPNNTIDPQGWVYIAWLFLVTFCYSYNAWCIVLRASFPYQTPDNIALWMMADYFCDLIYLLDALFVKPRLIYLDEGFLVDDPVATKKYYQTKLQYKYDIVSLMPLDILYFYYGPQKVILRFPRLLKLQTFWEFHQAMDRILSSPYVVRMGKTLFYIFYLIHLNACAYYALSDYIGLASNGWVYDNEGDPYIRCFFFATKTATSIGKTPKPGTKIEFIYMTVAWLMGIFVFACLISQVRDTYASATREKTEFRNKLDATIRYLRDLNLSDAMQGRVTAWFNYIWKQQRCFDEEDILNCLPYNMKRDLALEVHMPCLSKVELFRDCSPSLLRDLVLQLRPASFVPGDAPVRRGDVGHHMFIVKNGECVVMSADEKDVVAVLKPGSVFGEISLLGIQGFRRRTATVRSRGYSTLFLLSRDDLEAALKNHKEAAKILRRRADQIIGENAKRQKIVRDRPTGQETAFGAILTIEDRISLSSGMRRKSAVADFQKVYAQGFSNLLT